MPRRSKRQKNNDDSQSEEEQNDPETEATAVANVNKQNAKSPKRKKVKSKVIKACRNETNTPEIVVNRHRIRRNNETAVNESELDESQEEVTAVNFFEDGRQMRMVVRNEDLRETYSQSSNQEDFVALNADDDSEDGEIAFRSSDLENGQIAENENEVEMEVDPEETNAEVADSNADSSRNLKKAVQDHKKKLSALNEEMQNKIKELHKLMFDGGLTESAEMLNRCIPTIEGNGELNSNTNASLKRGKDNRGKLANEAKSMETIYESAVPKRNSSSSDDDLVNTSDEVDNYVLHENMDCDDVVDARGYAGRIPTMDRRNDRFHFNRRDDDRDPQPSTSRGGRGREITPEEKAQRMIREAEVAKARIYSNSGKVNLPIDQMVNNNTNQRNVPRFHDRWEDLPHLAACVDERYVVVSAHLDEGTMERIGRGEYIDFAKLLPKDRVAALEDEGKMELVLRQGKSFWVPVNTGVAINNFGKWEQAFRVFSNIYCKANPDRSAELIEYNHVIHTISTSYIWENVYNYDKEFRLHMARNPKRSWSIILQQAWSLRLRDRIAVQSYSGYNAGQSSHRGRNSGGGEPCRRFNRGKCNFGSNCKYDHRCSYCNKFGHGAVQCRKAIADRGHNNNQNNRGGGDNQSQAQTTQKPVQESNSANPNFNKKM